jgi:hypothetical protein
MSTEGTNDIPLEYSSWFGKPVILLVAIRQCPVPMSCRIIAESISDVRVLLSPGWELTIRKELILALKEDALDRSTLVN